MQRTFRPHIRAVYLVSNSEAPILGRELKWTWEFPLCWYIRKAKVVFWCGIA